MIQTITLCKQDYPVVCFHCGMKLEEEGVTKFQILRIPRIESDFDAWLADSKRVWSQLYFQMAARRRMKSQRRNTVR